MEEPSVQRKVDVMETEVLTESGCARFKLERLNILLLFFISVYLPHPPPDSAASTSRTLTPYMTKYERSRVLGARALQISMSAPVYVRRTHIPNDAHCLDAGQRQVDCTRRAGGRRQGDRPASHRNQGAARGELAIHAPLYLPIRPTPQSHPYCITPYRRRRAALTLHGEQGKIPFVIRRHLPNGSFEDWPVDQLIVD